MAHVFKTSLSAEEFKETLRQRAAVKGFEVIAKPNKFIIKNCIMMMSGIDFRSSFNATISTESDITVIKGHLLLPKFQRIAVLIIFMIISCYVLASGLLWYVSIIFLVVGFFMGLGMMWFNRYVYDSNFPLYNPKIMELFNSIVNDYPVKQIDQ
jgi:hypothetical protein